MFGGTGGQNLLQGLLGGQQQQPPPRPPPQRPPPPPGPSAAPPIDIAQRMAMLQQRPQQQGLTSSGIPMPTSAPAAQPFMRA
jgi:hypothetical protein